MLKSFKPKDSLTLSEASDVEENDFIRSPIVVLLAQGNGFAQIPHLTPNNKHGITVDSVHSS